MNFDNSIIQSAQYSSERSANYTLVSSHMINPSARNGLKTHVKVISISREVAN